MIKARFEDQKKINILKKRFSRARSLSFFSDKKNKSIYYRIKNDHSKKKFSVDKKTHRDSSSTKPNLQANKRNSSYPNEVSNNEYSALIIKKDDESKDRILIQIRDESKKDNSNDKINNNSMINLSYSSDTKKKSDEEKSERKIMKDILDQLKISNAQNSELIKKLDATFERMDKREKATIDLINMMKELIIDQRQNSGNIISSNNNNFNKNK